MYEQSKHSKCHYQKYLPDSPPESHATEVTSQSCIVPSDGGAGKQQFLKLVKSCYMYSGVQCSPLFDLDQLEQNVVAFYIAGKPRIQLEKIRTIFRFRNSPNETTLGNRYRVVKLYIQKKGLAFCTILYFQYLYNFKNNDNVIC